MRKVAGLITAVVVIAAIIGGTHKGSNSGASNSSASSSPASSSGSGSSAPQVVIFTVTGSAPAGADVTYGDDTSNYQGSVPMRSVLPLRQHVLYYAVNAQLNGGGSITCRVQIGTSVRIGHAMGGYNICSAQLSANFTGGWG